MKQENKSIYGCTLIYDDKTSTVTVIDKFGARLFQCKLEHTTKETMKRVHEAYDADNYWIAIKPADTVVFELGLFSEKKLTVNELDFSLV